MLRAGDPAPDFAVADTTLHQALASRRLAIVWFFPRAFTPG